MKQSKDPFEAAFEEQEESPPESPVDAFETQNPSAGVVQGTLAGREDDVSNSTGTKSAAHFTPAGKFLSAGTSSGPTSNAPKNKDDDDEEEEDNMDVELGKLPSSGDPDKMAKMQAILSQFTEEQMSRYESFRRAGFQKANMKRGRDLKLAHCWKSNSPLQSISGHEPYQKPKCYQGLHRYLPYHKS